MAPTEHGVAAGSRDGGAGSRPAHMAEQQRRARRSPRPPGRSRRLRGPRPPPARRQERSRRSWSRTLRRSGTSRPIGLDSTRGGGRWGLSSLRRRTPGVLRYAVAAC